DIAGADRVGDTHEHDRHSAGRLLQWPHDPTANRQDDIPRQRNHFGHVLANEFRVPTQSPADVDPRVAGVGPAQNSRLPLGSSLASQASLAWISQLSATAPRNTSMSNGPAAA